MDLKSQLAERKDSAKPVRHPRLAQLGKERRLPFGGRKRQIHPPLPDTVMQHGKKGALRNDRCIDLGVLEFEAGRGPGRVVPDDAMCTNQRMQRVHADEQTRRHDTRLVQATGKAVDQFLERQVVQACLDQPLGKTGRCHAADRATRAGGSARPAISTRVRKMLPQLSCGPPREPVTM